MTLIKNHPRSLILWISMLSLGGLLQWLGV